MVLFVWFIVKISFIRKITVLITSTTILLAYDLKIKTDNGKESKLNPEWNNFHIMSFLKSVASAYIFKLLIPFTSNMSFIVIKFQ